MILKKDFKVLDCTIRDGGYINNWDFPIPMVRELYRALSKAGVDYVELGYWGTDKYFDRKKYGRWHFSDLEDIREATEGINGSKAAVMLDFGKYDLEDIPERAETPIVLIRVATHKATVRGAAEMCTAIKKKGYETSLNLMGYSGYSEKERRETLALLKGQAIDYVYVADSYGSFLPHQIRPVFEPLLELKGVQAGFHPHNNMQMAFANTLAALDCGVSIVDGSVYGMGRAAGNLCQEILLAYLESVDIHRYNVLPVLDLIDRYFYPMHKKYGWGYQLPYLLSGIFECHPFYARDLVQYQEYASEDMWKILNAVKKKSPMGYSKEILQGVLVEGSFQGTGDGKTSVSFQDRPSYGDRHKGRDFLVLANGPTLKSFKSQIDQFIKDYDPVIIGVNNLDSMYVPHYHAFTNKLRFVEYAGRVHPSSRLLLSPYFSEKMIREYWKGEFEFLHYLDTLGGDFGIENGVVQVNCRTVSTLMTAIAAVMGAGRIFIAGMDGYDASGEKGGHHFYREQKESEERFISAEKQSWNAHFLTEINRYLLKRGAQPIVMLTPTVYKEFYRDISGFLQQAAQRAS